MAKVRPEVTKDYIKNLKSISHLQKVKARVKDYELIKCVNERIREISLDFYHRRKNAVPKNQRSAKEVFETSMKLNSPSSVRSALHRNKNILSMHEIRLLTKKARELDAISYINRKKAKEPEIRKDSKQFMATELEKWLAKGNKITDCDEIVERERLEIESRPLPKSETVWIPKILRNF